jgi:hypothetical protein
MADGFADRSDGPTELGANPQACRPQPGIVWLGENHQTLERRPTIATMSPFSTMAIRLFRYSSRAGRALVRFVAGKPQK